MPGVAQTIVVCRLRTVLELGRPRKTMACPTANLLYSYFLDIALASSASSDRSALLSVLFRQRIQKLSRDPKICPPKTVGRLSKVDEAALSGKI